jgi:amino acid adenylation domain-containing protein
MSALDLIARLRHSGIRLSVQDGKIRLKAEKGSLSEELKQEITAHKQDIIALLSGGDTEAHPELKKADRSGPLPLSYAQQRLWFLDELEPGTPVYNMPFALKTHGTLDRTALGAAFTDLISKHESLRTVFVAADNRPEQRILENIELPLSYEDMHNSDQQAVLERLREHAKTSFSLATGPLLKLHVIQTSATENTLLLVIHHIISDLWSMDVFFRELGQLYARQSADVAPQPDTLDIQYADYAAWQRDLLSGDKLERHQDYWVRQLADAPPVLNLVTDYPRPPEPAYKGRWLETKYAPELAKQLQELAKDSGTTMFMLTFAAFATLLNRYSGEQDLVIGTPISGRQHTELENLIGFFLNTLALRIEFGDNPTFKNVLEHVRKTALQGYAHQDLPFEKLVEELQPERDMSHTPVFQHMFIWQDAGSSSVEIPGLRTEPAILISHDTAKFDLTMALTNTPTGIEAGFEFSTELFKSATIERMLCHYETLLRAVVANPDAKLSELPLLDAAERTVVVEDFNATDMAFDTVCVHRMVEAQVANSPTAIAVELGDQQLTYSELNNRANALATHLRAQGAGAGKIVAVSLPRTLDLPVALLAVMKSGACYVPVDPNYPAERIQAMLDDSAAEIVLTESELVGFDFSGSADNLDGGDISDPLYCIYTSGSTGKPKGVQLSHAGLNNLLNWQNQHERLSVPAKTLQFASFSFDVHFQEFFGTWSNGGTTVMVDEELRQDLPRLAAFIDAQNIERLFLPYAALQPIAETLVANNASPALQDIIVAGEQLQVSPEVRGLFGLLNNAALHNQYGPSEAHVVTALTLTGDQNDWPALPSIGTPVANTHCYVLDQSGTPCPIGIPGELYLGGVQVGIGYLNRPELNAEKFCDSPLIDDKRHAERLYRTGDRVRFLSNGEIEFLGRADDQVKWRGFRIEPGEIEARLTEQPSVQQAIVLLREDTPGDKRLVAYVTGDNPDEDQLRQALKETLPDYMVPGLIVVLDELPLTPSGKVARRRLPVPEYSRDDSQPYVAPRNDTEQTLTELWGEVLKLEQVGIHDDFFQLGGHSLLATQLISRVRDSFGISLPLKYIFRYPSPAELGDTLATLEASRNQAQTADDDDRDEFRI